jgi:hypothetical protein
MIRVLKCADFDGAQSPEEDFIPAVGKTDAGPSGEGIDRHRPRHTKLHVVFPG